MAAKSKRIRKLLTAAAPRIVADTRAFCANTNRILSNAKVVVVVVVLIPWSGHRQHWMPPINKTTMEPPTTRQQPQPMTMVIPKFNSRYPAAWSCKSRTPCHHHPTIVTTTTITTNPFSSFCTVPFTAVGVGRNGTFSIFCNAATPSWHRVGGGRGERMPATACKKCKLPSTWPIWKRSCWTRCPTCCRRRRWTTRIFKTVVHPSS
mmetsp:Transcript_27692/g.64218  ORF Transcript_27692/g.64218 Transcript_27692/m.64218 type:complete len:206 (-) Transcript_27692:835-1452(-)